MFLPGVGFHVERLAARLVVPYVTCNCTGRVGEPCEQACATHAGE